jgi:hypothetical protein
MTGVLESAVQIAPIVAACLTAWYFVATRADKRLEILAALVRSPPTPDLALNGALRALYLRAVRQTFFPIRLLLVVVFAALLVLGVLMAAIGFYLLLTPARPVAILALVESAGFLALASGIYAQATKAPKQDADHIRIWLGQLEKAALDEHRTVWLESEAKSQPEGNGEKSSSA